MNNSENSFSQSATVGLSYASSAGIGLHFPVSILAPFPNMNASLFNIGNTLSMLPNMGTAISGVENIPPTLPNMEVQMSAIGNIPPASPKMESPMLNIANDFSYDGFTRNRETPNTNGVPFGSVAITNMETPIFDFGNVVMLPNMGTSMYDAANGVSHGGSINGVPHGAFINGFPHVNYINSVPHDGSINGVSHGGSINGFSYGGSINGVPHEVSSNGVPYEGSINGVTHGGFVNGVRHGGSISTEENTSLFDTTNGVPYGGAPLLNMETPITNNVPSGVSVANGNTNGHGHHTVQARGHPSGSTNSPSDANSAMESFIFQVPPGVDLVQWVIAFAKANKVYITVQGGSVAVSEAHISFLGDSAQPQIYKEHLTLITFSGAYVFSRSKQARPTYFSAMLSRQNGVIVGGRASKIITMGEVFLSAYVFKNPELFTINA